MISILTTLFVWLLVQFGNIESYIIPIQKGIPITVGLNNASCGDGTTYSWVKSKNGNVPLYAIAGGYEVDEPFIFVGRAIQIESKEGIYSYLPCKITSRTVKAYASMDGKEISSSNFEFLLGYSWIWQSINSVKPVIPKDAIVGGTDIDGEPLFVGRAKFHGDNLVIGRISPKDFKLDVSLQGSVGTFTPKDGIEILIAVCNSPSGSDGISKSSSRSSSISSTTKKLTS